MCRGEARGVHRRRRSNQGPARRDRRGRITSGYSQPWPDRRTHSSLKSRHASPTTVAEIPFALATYWIARFSFPLSAGRRCKTSDASRRSRSSLCACESCDPCPRVKVNCRALAISFPTPLVGGFSANAKRRLVHSRRYSSIHVRASRNCISCSGAGSGNSIAFFNAAQTNTGFCVASHLDLKNSISLRSQYPRSFPPHGDLSDQNWVLVASSSSIAANTFSFSSNGAAPQSSAAPLLFRFMPLTSSALMLCMEWWFRGNPSASRSLSDSAGSVTQPVVPQARYKTAAAQEPGTTGRSMLADGCR